MTQQGECVGRGDPPRQTALDTPSVTSGDSSLKEGAKDGGYGFFAFGSE